MRVNKVGVNGPLVSIFLVGKFVDIDLVRSFIRLFALLSDSKFGAFGVVCFLAFSAAIYASIRIARDIPLD